MTGHTGLIHTLSKLLFMLVWMYYGCTKLLTFVRLRLEFLATGLMLKLIILTQEVITERALVHTATWWSKETTIHQALNKSISIGLSQGDLTIFCILLHITSLHGSHKIDASSPLDAAQLHYESLGDILSLSPPKET